MTTNQIMIFLDIWRGTYNPNNHQLKLKHNGMDLRYLEKNGMVQVVDGEYSTTDRGNTLVEAIQNVARYHVDVYKLGTEEDDGSLL